jgi:hypothetical protein
MCTATFVIVEVMVPMVVKEVTITCHNGGMEATTDGIIANGELTTD